MARLKNTAFSGAAMHEVEPGAASYRRVLKEAIEDAALIYDKVTGENSESDTIIHDGSAGRGALLGIPLANQAIGRSLEVTTGSGLHAILPVPVFLPAGETSAVVEVFLDGERQLTTSGGLRLVFRDLSFNIDADLAFDKVADGHYSAKATGLTAGLNLMFAIYDAAEFDGGQLVGWRMHHGRIRGGQTTADIRRNNSDDDEPNPYKVTRSASVGLAHTDFDSSLLSDAFPYHAMLTAPLNRNLNALQEYITGWPVGGNADYTQIDNSAGVADSVNPSVSQFMAHTRSYFASEPLVDFPVCVVAMGACKSDGSFAVQALEPPGTGMLGWYAPWPKVISPSSATKMRLTLPDFPTGTSNLKAAILCCGNATAEAANWTGGITTSAGSATDAFAAVTGSGSQFYLSQPTAIPFNADTEQTIEVTFSRSGAGKAKVDEIALCGFCLFFEP